ncbi:hypothetical protein QX776_05380 [Alteromonadaceae bacterium BrNp21-10]|nr:hypothetical protein [Alteromonadaceae bacterium BrNp21-10]
MCSSPKSSGPKFKISRSQGLLSDMDTESRQRFAQNANQADIRRQQRLATQKRWQQKNPQANKKAKSNWLNHWLQTLFN